MRARRPHRSHSARRPGGRPSTIGHIEAHAALQGVEGVSVVGFEENEAGRQLGARGDRRPSGMLLTEVGNGVTGDMATMVS